MAQRIVRADYDFEAKSWYVFDSDVPGLSTGSGTLEELEAKLPGMILELLALNEHLFIDKRRLSGPHRFRLVAHENAYHQIAT